LPSCKGTAAISRLIDALGRTGEPEHVRRAEEAIRLYGFFRARGKSEGGSTSGGTAQEWDAVATELTRASPD
jgi:hypothetical protein